MLQRPEIEKRLLTPQLLSDPSFSPDTFLRDFGFMMFGAIFHKSGWNVDAKSLRIAGDADMVSILEPQRMLSLYLFDLGSDALMNREVRERFVARACAPNDIPAGGLLSDSLDAGFVTLLLKKEKLEPSPAEICEMRLVGWYIASLRNGSGAN